MNAVLPSLLTVLALTGLLLAGCVPPQAFDPSPGHIRQPAASATPPGAPPAPVRAAPILPPPGTAAPIYLEFSNIVGGKSGRLFPTGSARDVIDGVEVTCIDVAMPMILMRAADFGKTGHESKAELDADRALTDAGGKRMKAIAKADHRKTDCAPMKLS